MVNIYILWKIY